jgi:ribokinase
VLGSTNVDLIVKTDRLPLPGETVTGGVFAQANGGKGANQAVAAARAGANVRFLSAVGSDQLGLDCLAALTQEGIDTTNVIQVQNQRTGIALITVDRSGENCIVVASGANTSITTSDIDSAHTSLPEANAVVCQLETPLGGVSRILAIARARKMATILDPAPAVPLPDTLLANVDCLTPNERETEILTGIRPETREAGLEAASILRERGVNTVILTLGERGALLVDQTGYIEVAPLAVQVLDTTAAGDAFSGYLAAHVGRGASFRSALHYAICAGSLATQSVGAQQAIPSASEVEELKQKVFGISD